MKQYTFLQNIPTDIHTVWKFFSSPVNLSEITPPNMNFVITTNVPSEMYAGAIIAYKVSPFGHIAVRWVTEISVVEPLAYFVDVQLAGPFAIWHHQHHFRAIDGGVEMKDVLTFSVPTWALGRFAEEFIVSKRVEHIFDYRRKRIEDIFGKFTNTGSY